MTTTRTRTRRAGILIAAVLGLSIIAPTVANAAPTASAAPTAAVTAPSDADSADIRDAQPTGRMGVWANIYNRSGKATFTVKNRQSGVSRVVAPKQSTVFDKDFVTVSDEVELSVQIPGQEDFDIDIANPTIGWPNVTVDGDNENFAEWETKFFAVGDTRVEVQRHDDQGDRKRFFINITPPGPLQ